MMTEKSLPQPSSPQVRNRTLTPYVIGWSALATLSLLYLGALATQPALVAGYLGAGETTVAAEPAPQAGVSEAAVKQVAGEVQNLRNTIDLFRSELIELRAQVSSQTDAARDLTGRVASLETNPVVQRVAKEQAAKEAAKEKALAEAKAKEEKKLAAAEKAEKKKALETGSVAAPAAGEITFGPPTVTTTIAVPPGDAAAAAAAGRQIGVQIAKGPSVDSLRLSWTLLNERHGTAISSYAPRVSTDVSGPNQTYDLVIGPLASTDEARKLCHDLPMKATPCQVTRYTGDAL